MASPAVQPLLALLASDVGGNPTQYIFEKAFLHHDLDWRYLTFEVNPDSLGDALRGMKALGFRGGHCADPHKQAVMPWLDRCTQTAAMVGAVNLIFREEDALVGDNTEGKGALQAIRAALDPTGKQVVLLGAGRLARALAIELAGAGATGITVVNRTESHAGELVAMLAGECATTANPVAWQGDYVVPPEADILIRATSVGDQTPNTALPLKLDSLRPELLVADVAIHSPRNWLLREATQRGCKTIDGLSIFIDQIVIAFQLWTGVAPNRQVLQEAAEEFLEL